MKRHILLASLVAALISSFFPYRAAAQQGGQSQVVPACGTNNQTPPVGTWSWETMTADGRKCVSASVTITPSGTQDVNIKQVAGATVATGAGTATGTERVTVAQDSNTVAGSASLPAGTNVIGHVIVDTAPSTAVTNAGTFAVQNTAATPAGTNTIGGTVPTPSTSGGMSTSSAIVANNTTSVAVDASPGTLYAVRVWNIGATAWLKLYDAAQGSTTCGSGTPKLRILIPANSTAANGAGAVINIGGGLGVAFSTAITRCVTTGIADNDTTAPAASTYVVETDYK